MVGRPVIKHLDTLPWQPASQHCELSYQELLDPVDATGLGVAVSSILHERIAPGGSVLPHKHDVAEVIHFLEGEVRVLLGEEWSDCALGDTVLVPKGVTHGVENRGSLPSRQVSIFLPVVAGERFRTFLER
jgi:quercetin dioxygenase-like cupin family protein